MGLRAARMRWWRGSGLPSRGRRSSGPGPARRGRRRSRGPC
jgi:hypothetical protein